MTEKFRNIIKKFIKEEWSTDKKVINNIDFYIKGDSSLDDLGGDSLDFFILMSELEREYKIDIDYDMMTKHHKDGRSYMKTWDEICEYCEAKC